jgi:HSP20 family molecular chaperone IbpA
MNRSLYFDSPFLLGFDHTLALIERAAKAQPDSYPPYNVEATGEASWRITLAVAGFSAADLEIRLEAHQLTVAGKRETAPDGERSFVHRGIAARAFSRTFVLADGLEVVEASLEHGLLHIDLARPKPDVPVRRIPIRS